MTDDVWADIWAMEFDEEWTDRLNAGPSYQERNEGKKDD